MDERVLQLRVGVVILAALLLTASLMVILGEGSAFFRETYTVKVRFPEAPGVRVDTPVRRDGILIGRVSHIELLEPRGVLVTAQIDAHRTLTCGQTCRVNSQFPLGNAVLEFVSTDPACTDPLADGDVIRGRVSEDALDGLSEIQDDVEKVVTALTTAAEDASVLIRNVNRMVEENGGQFAEVMQKSAGALDQIEKAAQNVDRAFLQFQQTAVKVDQAVDRFGRTSDGIDKAFASVDRVLASVEKVVGSVNSAAQSFQTASYSVAEIFNDPSLRTNLKMAMQELPALLEDSRHAVGAAEETFVSFKQSAERMDRSLQSLEGLTTRVVDTGPRVMDRVDRTLQDVQELLNEMTDVAAALNKSEGTLGMLIKDPELYLRLNQAVANVECATRKLGPILDDAHVAMDKVARDPGGTVGVRGLLDRTPGGLKKVRPFGW